MKKCRMCEGTTFKEVIDMGLNPLVNSLVEEEDLDKKEKVYPLVVDQCQNPQCWLVQTRNPLDSQTIYKDQDYLYFSGDMPELSEYFLDYAEDIKERFLRDAPGFVVEIGSNDGILLKHFIEHRILGVDPATNVVIKALDNGIPTVSDFFTERVAENIEKHFDKADVIMANNCIAHLDDLRDLVSGVKTLLDYEGVFVVECNYWGGMVKNKNYSLIYHDHFSYFSLENWVNFLQDFDMEIFDAIITPAQGGSLRMFIGHGDVHEKTPRFSELLKEEFETQLGSYETAKQYSKNCKAEADNLFQLIDKLVKEGNTVAGYGAAAKGFSVLTLSGINEKYISYFVDDSPAKQGKFTPVTHIPVVTRDTNRNPDYFLITAPNYEDIIIKKEKAFLDAGGHFITIDGRIIGK